jgi:aminopeptidase N
MHGGFARFILALGATAILAIAPASIAGAGPKGKDKDKGGHGHGKFRPGATSLGDALFPQIGNGGYDAAHYRIRLDYDPEANVFDSAATRMTARATQNLSRFSMDFQPDLDVTRVKVNGERAKFRQVEATPDLSPDPAVTQPWKLIVTPDRGLKRGKTFTVRVRYRGTPALITDTDTSLEGWIPACHTEGFLDCDGAFVVNEPIGAQGWFPNNNYPTDKAQFDTVVTVPNSHTAFGVGELASRRSNGDGTSTWHWREDDPTATYLTTATVGLFDLSVTSQTEDATGRTLPLYNAIDSSYNAVQKANVNTSLSLAPGMLNYLGSWLGPYPFDSGGAVVDRTTGVFYALEVQTKSHFSQLGSTSNDISDSTLLHEIAHQWMGNSITLSKWLDISFNEGWATWFEWIWAFETQGGDDPEAIFDDLYANTPDEEWEIAPAVLDGDPANLFHGFPVYDRSAMTIQGVREIIGEHRFRHLLDELAQDRAHSNISIEEYIDLIVDVSDFHGQRRALLRDFLDQWLYGETKPTILPEDFEEDSADAATARESAQPPPGSRAQTQLESQTRRR